MKSKKKIIFIISTIFLVLLIASISITWLVFGTQISVASSISIEKLEDGLYSMEYSGDYGLDGFLEQGGAKTDDEVGNYIRKYLSNGFDKSETETITKDFGCSTLVAENTDGYSLMGRNYDWELCSAMIVHLKPADGYESISTTCIDFLGFEDDWNPENMTDKVKALAAIYVPVDGINEKGLCIADLVAGDNEHTAQETDEIDITTTMAIRLILDKAATVDEAIELLEKYDMNSSIGYAHHLAISDATGKSVVVEYIDNKMYVTETPVVTNHYLTEGKKYGVGIVGSEGRYNNLIATKEMTGGIMDKNSVKDAMRCVSSGSATQWTIIYDTKALTIDFYFRVQFDNPYTFKINN